jgi:hypothetical protein
MLDTRRCFLIFKETQEIEKLAKQLKNYAKACSHRQVRDFFPRLPNILPFCLKPNLCPAYLSTPFETAGLHCAAASLPVIFFAYVSPLRSR